MVDIIPGLIAFIILAVGCYVMWNAGNE